MNKEKGKKHLLLMIFTLLASILYIGWRIFFTLPLHNGIVSLVAGLALVIAETIGVLEAIEHYLNMSTGVEPDMPDIPQEWYPDVDVLIATHNETPELLYKTINGCNHLKYPVQSKVHVYICDDSNRPEMAELAQRMGVGYFGLSENKHAKAGNLNNALRQTSSPLVATFDADMIPTSAFLMETVPYFFLPRMEQDENGVWKERETPEDEKIGFIQTPQSFYNPDLFQYNLYSENSIPNEQDYFFREVNVGRNRSNSPIYAGSNTVISREAIEEVDYIKTGTITEDFATGIEIQKKGYRCYAVDKTLAHGLAPEDVPALIKQRERWGRGCVQTMRSFGFLFGKMPLLAKISYFSSFMYWWTFLRRFIYVISPILYTVFGVQVVNCSLWQLAIFWLPYYLLYNRALRVISGDIRNQRWSNIVDTIIFPYMIIPIFLESIGLRQRKFIVTNKAHNQDTGSGLRYAIPHLLLVGATAVGLVFCLRAMVVHQAYASIVLVFWLVVNLYFLLMAVFFMRGRVNFRREERLLVKAQVSIKLPESGRLLSAETTDLSESGMALVLDFPEYIPYDTDVSMRIEDSGFEADFFGRVTHVAQAGNQWKYSIKITEIEEMQHREYLQLLYDRHHTLPIIITSNAIHDVKANLRGRKSSLTSSNRRLPRMPMNQTVSLKDGGTAILEDFNYEFLRLSASNALPDMVTIVLGDDTQLHCARVKGTQKPLYRVENWQEISTSAELRTVIVGWLGQVTSTLVDATVGS